MPQLMPVGELVIVPLPVPSLLTLSVKSGLKVAVTFLLAVMLTVQVLPLVDVQPDQLLKR